MTAASDDAEAFLAGSPLGLAVYRRLLGLLRAPGPVDVRTTRSQVAFRRRRSFAWLWLPGRWLAHPDAEVVLSIALGRRDPSSRWKEVVHPSSRHWIHHLELQAVADIDDAVAGWLAEAAERAG